MAGTDSHDLTIESDTESIYSQSEFYQDLFDVPILSGKFIDDNCLQSDEDVDSDNSDSDYSDTFLAAKYLKPSSTPISPVSVSPPKFDAPISPVSFSPPKLQSFNMEKLGQCRKFSGYSQDNASKFLSEFQSFATLHGLDNSSERKVAAFHLHLQGPALQWFDSLESVLKSSWDNLEPCFRKKYLELGRQSSTVMLESELFQKMSLLPGQSLEDYYSSLSEKGQILKKPDHELMVRFINGLPEKLAFFVRAGNHEDSSAALAAAKMGETFGYRLHDASVSVAAVRPKEVSEISELREQVKTLTSLVQSMSVHGSTGVAQRPKTPSKTCYACHSEGHVRRNCNWNGASNADPSFTCQICFQKGHQALQCHQFMAVPPPSLPHSPSGNFGLLGNPGHRPRGGYQ